jgi:hypothetical protein
MRARREHGECSTEEGGRGCLVYGSRQCIWKEDEGRWKRWIRALEKLDLKGKFGLGLVVGIGGTVSVALVAVVLGLGWSRLPRGLQ